jgi:hypothetical protein
MTLYGTFNAEGARETPMINFIEFEFPKVADVFVPNDLDNKDIVLSCDWDESDWDFDNERGIGCFRAKGVYLNQRYANGHISDFMNAKIDTLQVSGIDTDVRFELTGLMIDDGGMMFSFPDDKIIPWMTEYAE